MNNAHRQWPCAGVKCRAQSAKGSATAYRHRGHCQRVAEASRNVKGETCCSCRTGFVLFLSFFCVFYPALSLCFLSHSSGLLASQSSSQSLGCCQILSICLLLLVSFCRMVAASVDPVCLCVCQVSLQQLRTSCCAHNSQIQSTRWNSCAKTMWKPEQRYQQSCIQAVQQVQQACLLPHQPEGCGQVQQVHLRLPSE